MPRKIKGATTRTMKGSVSVNVRIDGKLYHGTLPAGSTSVDIANWRTRKKADVAEQTNAPPTAGTFAADVQNHLPLIQSMPSAPAYAAYFRIWLAELGGDRPSNSITPRDIDIVTQRWLTGVYAPVRIARGKIKDGPLKAATIIRRRYALQGFFKRLNGKAGYNPVRGAESVKRAKPAIRGVDYATVDRILAALPHRDGRPGEPTIAMIIAGVMAATGLPPAIIKSLRPQDILLPPTGRDEMTPGSRDFGSVRVERHKGDGVEERDVPLTPRGRDAMRAFVVARDGGLFKMNGKRVQFSGANVNKSIKTAAASIGIGRGRFHLYDLRHSFLTQVYRKTRDTPTVARYAVHAAGSPMTLRYAAAANAEVDRAAAAVIFDPAPVESAQSVRRKVRNSGKSLKFKLLRTGS